MKRSKVIVTDRATASFKRIISGLKEVSLIGGEDARLAILDSIRKLGVNPMANSKAAKFERLDGEYRKVDVWDYRIYYKVEEGKVIVLDIILQPTKKAKS